MNAIRLIIKRGCVVGNLGNASLSNLFAGRLDVCASGRLKMAAAHVLCISVPLKESRPRRLGREQLVASSRLAFVFIFSLRFPSRFSSEHGETEREIESATVKLIFNSPNGGIDCHIISIARFRLPSLIAETSWRVACLYLKERKGALTSRRRTDAERWNRKWPRGRPFQRRGIIRT